MALAALALWFGAPTGLGPAVSLAALAATLGAVLLGTAGWALRPPGGAPPPWVAHLATGSLATGGALTLGVLGAGLGGFGGAALGAAALALLLAWYRAAGRLLPPGFAPRVTSGARVLALAAAALWALGLALSPGALLALPARALGAAACLGVLALGLGWLAWLEIRPRRPRRP